MTATARATAPRPATHYTVVSMFSGCGGMDMGFRGGFEVSGKTYEALPFEIVWANDLSPAACKTYEHNLGHPARCGDVWEQLDTLPKQVDLVVGGFPCQDVSVNGKRRGIAEGTRTGLYRAMVEAVRRLRPKMFVAENVKGLLSDDRRPLLKIMREFESLDYDVTWKLYQAADYGVPQMRERVLIVGTSKRHRLKPFVHPDAPFARDQRVTAKAAIDDLAKVEESRDISHVWSRAKVSGEQGNRRLKADHPAATIRAECHGNSPFHYDLPRRISMREAARIQSFPDSFRFLPGLRETERLVGNAVPPVLAWHMARAISDHLK